VSLPLSLTVPVRLLVLKDREAEMKLRKSGRSVANAAAEIPRPFSAVAQFTTQVE